MKVNKKVTPVLKSTGVLSCGVILDKTLYPFLDVFLMLYRASSAHLYSVLKVVFSLPNAAPILSVKSGIP